MKAKMYSAESNTRLHKTIDEFFQSNEGINNLRSRSVIQDKEYINLVQRNIDFFFARIKEFRLAEKMLCIFFACLFAWMQSSADDLEMRRPRSRASRITRTHRPGRKKE